LKKNKSAAEELFEVLYSPADPLPLGLFRVVFGIVLLFRFLTLCLQFDPLFTANSPMSLEASRLFSESPSTDEVFYFHWDLFLLSDSTLWAAAVFAGYGASIVAFLLGWRTRLATLLVFLFTVSFNRREPIMLTGGDILAQFMLFWLLFVPAGAALSLDATRRRGDGATLPVVRAWNLGFLQAQLALVYFSTFLLKMGTATWKEGRALTEAWNLTFHGRPWGASLAAIPGIPEVSNYATLLFEVAFAFFIWNRRIRPWLLAAGVLLHIGIELTIRAGPFSSVMLACYIPFLDAETVRRWAKWFAPLREAIENIRWQLAMLREGRWVFYYNGHCGFCRRWVGRAQKITLRRVEWRDFHQHGAEVAHLNLRFDRAAYLVIDRRTAFPGFRAFRRLLLAMPLLWLLLPLVYLPGARPLGDVLYRYISVKYGPVDQAPACRVKHAKT
jgi:predicted DCC family thiol-disulfide oxidoreductase YuxK